MAGEAVFLDRIETAIPVSLGSTKGTQGVRNGPDGSRTGVGRVSRRSSGSGSGGLGVPMPAVGSGSNASGGAMVLGGGNGGGGSSGLSGSVGKGGAGGLGGGRRGAVPVVGLLDPGGGGLWWWEEVEEKELLGLGGQDGVGLGGPVKRRLRKKILVERKRVRGEVAGGREEDEVGSRKKKRAVTEDTEESGSQKGVRGLFPDPIME